MRIVFYSVFHCCPIKGRSNGKPLDMKRNRDLGIVSGALPDRPDAVRIEVNQGFLTLISVKKRGLQDSPLRFH